jgi:hypothetical protein
MEHMVRIQTVLILPEKVSKFKLKNLKKFEEHELSTVD